MPGNHVERFYISPGNVKGKSLKALIVSGGGPMREAQYAIVDEPSRSEPNGQGNESI